MDFRSELSESGTRGFSTGCAHLGKFIRCPILAAVSVCSRKLWIFGALIRHMVRRRFTISQENLRREKNEEGSINFAVAAPAVRPLGAGRAARLLGYGSCGVASSLQQTFHIIGIGSSHPGRRRSANWAWRTTGSRGTGRVL